MNFELSFEQQMIVDTLREFVEKEIYPHEAEVDKTGEVPLELGHQIRDKCLEAGYFAANIAEEFGGGGLGHLDFTLLERELGRASNALTVFFGRPSGILMACDQQQQEKYLIPAVRGEKFDALAMTEPAAGSDVRGMEMQRQTSGRRLGSEWQQTLHQSCRYRRLRHRIYRHRRRTNATWHAQENHLLPGRPRHTRFRNSAGLQLRQPPRLQKLHTQLRQLSTARITDTG